jgi:hypothetical protein
VNRQERRALRYTIEDMTTKILREEETWEERWAAFCGCCQGVREFPGIDQAEFTEFVGLLARTVVARLKAPPITEPYQMLIYFTSSDAAHRGASFLWQREHQAELIELQRQHPDINLLERVGTA